MAFLYNAGLVLAQTGTSSAEVPGIRVLGFTGPAGSFLTLCGILLQFLAIVWDDWWHGVYGLDVGGVQPTSQPDCIRYHSVLHRTVLARGQVSEPG